ncbi:MAG: hypothetical protein JXR34_11775 [Bacteroidales bacterium]|nr:hypothetical protein [Bacteroidales bacterium]
MRKITFLFLFSMISIISFSQSHKAGTLSFQGAWKLGFVGSQTNLSSSGINVIDLKDNGISSQTVLRAHYNVFKFLSLGVVGSYGIYTDDSTLTNERNYITNLGLEARIYVINWDKFNIYGGMGVGLSNLKMTDEVGSNSHEYKLTSPIFDVHAGFNWYLLKIIGFHSQLGLAVSNYDLNKYVVNGTEQNISNLKMNKSMAAFEWQVGLSLKIN